MFSGYVREQKRYTKNELKHIFSFDEAGVEKFIKSLKAYGVLKSVKNSNAQLEIMLQTRKTLLEYMDALKESNPVLYEDIKKYSHGARCSFPDYVCPADCKFKEGKILVRKI